MENIRRIFLILNIIACFLQSECADKYNDENRPYEFGFSIDGEQHRHEKKDENGIIMGEFGFITADGVYHVTVYATDENGNFKILSMKNIRVKPYPTASPKDSRKGHSLSFNNSNQPPASPVPDQPKSDNRVTSAPPPSQEIQLPPNPQPAKPESSPIRACSHCSLPTTTTLAPKVANVPTYNSPSNTQLNEDKATNYNQNTGHSNNDNSQGSGQTKQSSNFNSYGSQQSLDSQKGSPIETTQPERTETSANKFLNNEYNPQQFSSGNQNSQFNDQTKPIQDNTEAAMEHPGQNLSHEQNSNSNPTITEQQGSIGVNPQIGSIGIPEFNDPNNNSQKEIIPQAISPTSNDQKPSVELLPPETIGSRTLSSTSGDRNPKKYDPSQDTTQNNLENLYKSVQLPAHPPEKPILVSAQMQHVDKNTDIYHKNPGEKEGLPEGVTKDYMSNVLYVFNYTVGFHGHFEKGFSNGAKQGYYYVTGRNGIRTRVDYEADEKGFRPKISQEVLDLLSDEVPKPDTEKDPKYGLQHYEFKWLYFPVETEQ